MSLVECILKERFGLHSVDEIAQVCGCSTDTVRKVLNQYGDPAIEWLKDIISDIITKKETRGD